MKQKENETFISQFWDAEITPTLMEYIKIPNKSPAYDKDWQAKGFMAQAVQLIAAWCKKHALPDMKLDVIQLENKTPIILIDLPAQNNNDTVLLYGHLDKQPELSGWDDDLGPWKPVLRADRLYGRGSADDGYAVFAALTALKALHQQNITRARCVILIEACEESGSGDLPFYIEKLIDRLGNPSLVVCLDSGCINYEQLWITTSLRGLADGVLTVEVLKEGIHSGIGSGIVPSPFRILRQLLDRIEDQKTGDVKLKELQVEIPKERQQQMQQTAEILSSSFMQGYGFLKGVTAESASNYDLLMRNTWRPALSVTGCDGFPLIENAGNVIVPKLAVKLSLRIPPTCHSAENVIAAIKNTLEKDPPYHANVTFSNAGCWPGWNTPQIMPWLTEAIDRASQDYFGRQAAYMGEGASIPFMGMLGEKFPQAQFIITGLLGPESNAHGPNEFLHIPMAKKLTACIAQVIAEHFQHR